MNQDKFVVVGTGRSGTGYCSAVLNACGVRCGHQSVFKHENTLSGEWDWRDFDGDSSFEAVPLLPRLQAEGVRVVAVVRHPLAVARSWLELGLFRENMRSDYEMLSRVLDQHFPEVLRAATPHNRALMFWREWNLAAIRHSDLVLTLEHLSPIRLFEGVGHPDRLVQERVDEIPRTTNAMVDAKVHTVDEHEFDFSLVAGLAQELGYT